MRRTFGGTAGTALFVLLPLLAGRPASGQLRPQLGERLRVFVLTAEPGDLIWEKFGHNAIRIVDPSSGSDAVWNWGLFDFSQQGFYMRLARGTMLYSMGPFTPEAFLAAYAGQGRAVWSQELDLLPEEKLRLRDAILENAKEENRQYRYDYYRDNCSTRVRDMIDLATGGQLAQQFRGRPTGTTYRWHTRRLLRDEEASYLGIEFVLGNRADEPIDAWQEMFLPMKLRGYLTEATVERGGISRPLVSREVELLPSRRAPAPADVPDRMPAYAVVGLAIGAMIAVAGASSSSLGAVATRLIGGGWALVAGLGGTILFLAWLLTDHVFWGWNENLFQANPLLLLLAFALLIRGVRGPSAEIVRRTMLVGAGLALLGTVIQVLPGFDQVNGEILALALPPNLAMGWVAWRAGRREERG